MLKPATEKNHTIARLTIPPAALVEVSAGETTHQISLCAAFKQIHAISSTGIALSSYSHSDTF